MCAFYNPTNEEISNKMYETYGINAAHPVLPHHTKVEVTYNKKKLLVTINDIRRNINSTGEILLLSREAANIFNIKDEGLVPCQITIPLIENNWYLKGLMYLLPYISLMALLRFL